MTLRICRISHNLRAETDGLSKHVLTLSRRQAERGHDVFLLQPFEGDREENGLRYIRAGTAPRQGRLAGKLSAAASCLLALKRAHDLRKAGGFDVLHAHGDVIDAFFCGLYGRLTSIPVVLTVHGGLNRGMLYRTAASWLFSMVDRIVAISRWVKADLNRVGVGDERICVVSTGIDFDELSRFANASKSKLRRKWGIDASARIVVAAGRLHPVKGFRYLIEAARRLSRRGEIRFIIIGDGTERALLERLAEGLACVELRGKMDRASVWEHLRCADLFALTSVDLPGQSEAIPTAMLEAFAVGLPVVANGAGESGFLIEDGVNGYMAAPADPDSLADAIDRALEDLARAGRVESISTRNRAIAAQRDWSEVIQQIDAVYAGCLGAHDSSGEK